MKKLIFTTLVFSLFVVTAFAQVGIGTTTPNASSVLDLTSTNKAFLPPRMNTASRDAIVSPVAGMVIFNTTTNCIELYRGSGWYNMCTGGTTLTPTITSFTPSSGPVGTTVTITGTNLTGSVVKFNNTTATVSVNTATSITCTVPSGATSGTITATTGDGTATSATSFTVTVGGLTSNDVAPSSLIAHWTFDNTKAEAKSGQVPTTTGTVTNNATGGRIGGYVSFNNGYLLYPTINNLNKDTALAAGFTFSSWVKFAQTTAPTNLLTSLWQINGNIGDIWGTAAFTYRHGPDSTLDFDGTMTHVNGTGTHPTYADAFLEGAASGFKAPHTDWVLVTMVYDTTGGSKKIKYYGNGVLRGTKTIATTVIPATEQFELITTASFGGTGRSNVTFGSFNYSPTPFATGGGTSASWQNTSLPNGTAIDDTRIFNKALSQSEITDLYTRGLAGN